MTNLAHCRPGPWYLDLGRQDERRRQDVAAARDRVRRSGKAETEGRVIAELNFGFWRYLLSGRYEHSLWTPTLRHAFPQLRPQRRDDVYTWVEQLNRLRNPIAHHEPVHRRDLAADHAAVLATAAAICPTSGEWLDGISRVPVVLAARPR